MSDAAQNGRVELAKNSRVELENKSLLVNIPFPKSALIKESLMSAFWFEEALIKTSLMSAF
jgi:hypothetical protein